MRQVIVLYCRLLKTVYGLRQSGRNWNSLLTSYMVSAGFVKSESGPMFVCQEKWRFRCLRRGMGGLYYRLW